MEQPYHKFMKLGNATNKNQGRKTTKKYEGLRKGRRRMNGE